MTTTLTQFLSKQQEQRQSTTDYERGIEVCYDKPECCDKCLDFSCYGNRVKEELSKLKRASRSIKIKVEKRIMWECIDKVCLEYCLGTKR